MLYGCASLDAPHTKRHPKSHILTTNKKVMKDNIRYQKEHAKAAQKRRAEISEYLQDANVSDNKNQRKRSNKY